MARLKLDQEMWGFSSTLERMTGARVKDCFLGEDTLYFVVAPGDVGKVVGKGGFIIQQIQREFGKRIRVIEYQETLPQFVRNVIYPLDVQEIREENGLVLIRDPHKKTKSLLIGRGGKNLAILNRAVKRFFPVTEVRVE